MENKFTKEQQAINHTQPTDITKESTVLTNKIINMKYLS